MKAGGGGGAPDVAPPQRDGVAACPRVGATFTGRSTIARALERGSTSTRSPPAKAPEARAMTAIMAMPADVDARSPRPLLRPRRSATSEEAVTVAALRTT